MTAEQFTPSIPHRDPQEELEGSFCTRTSITHGTRAPSGLRSPVGSPDSGNIHRDSVKEYKQVDTTQVYMYRPIASKMLRSLRRMSGVLLGKFLLRSASQAQLHLASGLSPSCWFPPGCCPLARAFATRYAGRPEDHHCEPLRHYLRSATGDWEGLDKKPGCEELSPSKEHHVIQPINR